MGYPIYPINHSHDPNSSLGLKANHLKNWLTACLLCLVLIFNSEAHAESIQIVVPSESTVNALDTSQINALFLAKPGAPAINLIVFDRSENDLRQSFYQQLAGMSLNRLRAYWAKRVFTSRGRPPKGVSAEELERMINNKQGFITYVFASEKPEGTKTVLDIPLEQ